MFNIDFDQGLRFVKADGWTNLDATRHQGVQLRPGYVEPGAERAIDLRHLHQGSVGEGGAAGTDLPFYSRRVGTIGTRYERGQWLFNADAFFQSNQNSPAPTAAALNDGSGRAMACSTCAASTSSARTCRTCAWQPA
ncbi:hypothetical protein OL229_03075 [Neisseriaceae bacterium JH1-16]|nr:hypothetical protein [Neisseriaceae bacterium JH1-16]